MSTREVQFLNRRGEQLSGQLEEPDQAPTAGALFAHCFTCSKDFKAPVRISRALAELGVATLRFDFPGLGHSEGRFADTTLSKNVEDVVSAAAHLEQRGIAPRVLIGHSMGGAAVLRAAQHIAAAKLTVCLAAPAQPTSTGILQQARDDALRDGIAEFEVAGRTLQLRREFFDDLEGRSLLEEVSRLSTALMVFHGMSDFVVPIAHGEQLFAAAPQPKSFLCLGSTGHMIDRVEDAGFIAETVATWLRQYA